MFFKRFINFGYLILYYGTVLLKLTEERNFGCKNENERGREKHEVKVVNKTASVRTAFAFGALVFNKAY